MKQFQRITSLCLLCALVLSMFGGIPIVVTSTANESTNVQTDIDGNPVINLLEDKNWSFDALTIPGWSVMKGVAQCDDHLYDDGGVWALKLADNSSTEAVWSVSDKNEITAGEKYCISAQVYGGVGVMTVYFYDAADALLEDQTITMRTASASDSWQTLSQNFTAVANAAKIEVKVSTTVSAADTVWFDAVVLESMASSGFELSFENGDFNSDWVGGIPANWKFNADKAALSKTDWDNNGDFELSVDSTKASVYWLYTNNFPVVAGYPYTASVEIYQTAAARGQLFVQFFANEGDTSAMKSNYITFTGEGLSEGWTTLAVNEIAPIGANYARILIIGLNSGGTNYYDNAKISFANELYNASYEHKITQEGGSPLGVIQRNSIPGSVTTDEAHTGSQSIVTTTTHWWDTFRLVATPGDTYEATAWVKGDAATAADDNADCGLLVYFYGQDGKQISVKDVHFNPTGEWQQMKLTCEAPLDAYSVKAMIYRARSAGKVYIDDISLTKLTDKKMPRNVLFNGGFENYATADGVNSPIADLFISSVNQKNLMAVDYVGGAHGYAGRFLNASSMIAWTDTIPITAGETYSATVDVRGDGRFQLFIQYYTSTDAARADFMKTADGKDCGKNNSMDLKKDWRNLAVSGSVAPEGATHARVWIVGLYSAKYPQVDANFDNLTLFEGTAKIQVLGETGQLWNPGFEEINEETGEFAYWPPYASTNVLSIVDANENPDDVFEGRYALKLTVPPEMSGTHGTFCEPFPVEGGTTYTLSAYVKESFVDAEGFQMGLKYYNKYGDMVAAFYATTPAIGEWNYIDLTSSAPNDATYVTVYLVSGAGKGSVCFDKMNFQAVGNAEYAPVMFEKDDWEVTYNAYPRLDFDREGLERIRRFSKSKSVCAYGYAGNLTMQSLLKQADAYLQETVMRVSYFERRYDFPLYPVLEDPTCRPDFEIPPEGFTIYPYLTQFTSNMLQRVQTLSLAYAITGDLKYGERAKQYALDMCDWEYWIAYWAELVNNAADERSSQNTGYILDSVITAYDLCYDLFSKQEIAKMDAALIEKGLEAMYHDCWPRMSRDRDMDHATGLILASCVMLREDNVDQLKKYLDMGMTYINWRLNYFLKSGVNEGHLYDSLAIDDIIVTLATLERLTGYVGPWDHPYMEQLQIAFTGFFEMVNGTLPAYGDSQYRSNYYPYSAAVFSQKGNKLATYYLAVGGGLASNYDKLVWHTDMNIAELEVPDERDGNVNHMSAQGFGSLRTGWDILDSILVIAAYDSHSTHNHYDQNSIQLAFSGTWMLNDSEYRDMSGSTLMYWQTKYTNSTIFVDGKPQVRQGLGSLRQVFDTHIYGYLIGSAPDAYGLEDKQPVLNQFDRHAIMINHDSQPYYVIIDDLESNKDRNFGWNFYTNGWDRLEIDGQHVPEGSSASGNRIAISRFGCALHSYFVGDAVTYKELTYGDYGPTLLLESPKASNYQFMNILSTQKGSGSQISTLFEPLMTGESSQVPSNDNADEINWSSTRTDTTKNTLLSVSIGSRLVMFRAGEVGDWVSFPFSAPNTKDYRVYIDVGQGMSYTGEWNVYIDDQLIGVHKPYGPLGIVTIDAGMMNLEAGDHRLKLTLTSTPETPFGGTIMSVGSITLDTGEGIGKGPLTVLEEYNEGDLLGARIAYGTVLNDVVVFNRGANEISASGLSTNGQQASVIGLNGDDIAEGFAVTEGTLLRYGDQLLVTSEAPVSIAMDYTMAKYPVKNDDSKDPVEVHEDFDIKNPIYYVSAYAEAATKVTLNVGVHAPYIVKIGDVVLESTHSGEMLTFMLPAGDSQITIFGTHQHVFDQHATSILNIKEWAGCGHANEYFVSCVCGENGTKTFLDGAVKGHNLEKVAAVEATKTENGNKEYWVCKSCGKLFADAASQVELTENEIITAYAGAESMNWVMVLCTCVSVIILAGTTVAVIVIQKKKKR